MISDFYIEEAKYITENQKYYESLFSLSNGYIGFRNSLDFTSENSKPGFFCNELHDKTLVVKNEIIALPNFMDIRIFIDDEEVLLDECEIISYNRTLNISEAIVYLDIVIRMMDGKIIEIIRENFVSISQHNYSCIRYSVVPRNFFGKCKLLSLLNCQVCNTYFNGYNSNINIKHYKLIKKNDKFTNFRFETLCSKEKFEIHIKETFDCDYESKKYVERSAFGKKYILQLKKNKKITLEKIQFFQKNDIDDTTFDKMSTYEGIKKNHLKKLEQLWKIYNITLSITDQKIITAIHFNILQMIMNIPHNCVDGNIASRGLSSEYHSGHYFFNSELFKNPYFLYTEPRISKSMINFRKKTLNSAIRNAKEMGYDGARYPEEVDDYGNAAGPTIIESTLEDKVIEEWTGRKSHFIGGFVIYSIEKYLAVTDDYSILQNGGLDLVLEVCKFYVSLLKYSKVDNLYHIDNCIGVDEYHIGINDSFLVNYMAKYVIEYTLSLLENLYDNRDIDEIMNKHNINNENISKWKHISSKIYLSRCFNNVYEEFKGYFDLKDELVLNDFKNRPNISTKINYISQNLLNCDSKVIKQSDVVLLLALFVDKFSLEKITSSLLYYDQRTIHESSLSTVHTALLYLYINNFDKAFHYFKLALYYDLNFYPKSNYNNGIHLASASGSLLLIYEGFLGIKIHKNYIRFSPKLNTFLNMIKVPIVVRDKRFFIKIEKLSNEYLLKIYDSDEVYLRKIHFKNDVIIKIEEIINL